MSSYAKFKDEWVALYKQGMSMRAIGGRYGVSAGTVKNVIKYDVESRKNAGKYDAYIEKWISKYRQGSSVQQIAKQYNVAHSTVKMYLLKNGIEIRTDKSSAYLVYQEQWAQLYAQGCSLKEIGNRFGVVPDTVRAIILPVIQMRDYVESSNAVPFDETYFEKVDTEEKAYWLGVCFAFGYISKRLAKDEDELKVTFVFRENELCLAEELKQQLQTEKKLSFNAEDNLYRLEFLNRSFIMSLVAAGIKPNERRGFQLPALVESLRVPFLVGYLEKRCYLDRARVHIQVPNGEALELQAFLQELGVYCEIRQKKVGNVISVVTSSSADTKAF